MRRMEGRTDPRRLVSRVITLDEAPAALTTMSGPGTVVAL
jgi:threonine dehydrogenase-like Zn-dependent dehydrogenase